MTQNPTQNMKIPAARNAYALGESADSRDKKSREVPEANGLNHRQQLIAQRSEVQIPLNCKPVKICVF